MQKIAFYTLGCKLNFSETSSMSRKFEEEGFKKVDFSDKPDIFLINTCSVTDNADKKCRKVVKEALKQNENAYIAIVGCYAQLKPKEIADIPGVDVVLGAAEKFQLLEHVKDFTKNPKGKVIASEIKEAKHFNEAYSFGDRTRTFLKVQDGCNYNCSFCTIPLARGKSRSPKIDNIVAQAKEIATTSCNEVVLTGVNIGDFGINLETNKREERFINLIKALDEVEGIDRYRISSIEPNLLSEEVIDFVAQSKRFVPHFHIPLQSGNDKMLKAMRRRYNRALYEDRIAYIKKIMPDCCIGVDVITGFPGEGEEEFLDTYNFLNELNISYLHVFTYSERDNTPALDMKGVVPYAERKKRSIMLRTLSEKKRRAFYESQLGTKRKVLFESDIEEGKLNGFTENYVKVEVKYDPVLVNEVKEIQLKEITHSGNVSIEEIQEKLIH